MANRVRKSLCSVLALLLTGACETSYQFGTAGEVRDAVVIDNEALPRSASDDAVGYRGPPVYGPCYLYAVREPAGTDVRHQIRFGELSNHQAEYLVDRLIEINDSSSSVESIQTRHACWDEVYATIPCDLDSGKTVSFLGFPVKLAPPECYYEDKEWLRNLTHVVCGHPRIDAASLDNDEFNKMITSGITVRSEDWKCYFSPEYIDGYRRALHDTTLETHSSGS